MNERLWCTACGTVTGNMICDCNRWPDGHEMKREPNFVNYADEMQKTAHEQAQEIERLRKGIRDYLDGNYESPRAGRVHGPQTKCRHGMFYWDACENCIDDHFARLLTPAERPGAENKGTRQS